MNDDSQSARILWIGRMIFGQHYRVREVELAKRLTPHAKLFALDHTEALKGERPSIADRLRLRMNLWRAPFEVLADGTPTRFRMPVTVATGPTFNEGAAALNERNLRRALARFDCDRVFLSTPFFFMPPRERSYKVHYDVVDNFHDQWPNTRVGRARQAFHREQLIRADTVSASSLQLCDYVERLADRAAVYIPNGAPQAEMRASDPGRALDIRTTLGIDDRFVIGFIGNHSMTFYGLERLVRAFVLARKQRPELALMIVGPDSDRALRFCNGEADGVYIVGPVSPSEVAPYFHACDAGAHPYDLRPQTHDAMALNVIEFSAAGKPVLSNPFKEFQRLALPNVRFTDGGEVRDWAPALADPASFGDFDRAALKDALAPFDWDRSADLLAGTMGLAGPKPAAQMRTSKLFGVTHFERKPIGDYHSMEKLFSSLRTAMLDHADIRVEQCPVVSHAIRPRLRNLRWARRAQGRVNHITGDVHYLALAMAGERTLLTVHDCVALRRATGPRAWLLRKLYFQWPVNRAQIVTTISETSKAELVKVTGCDPAKIRVVPNCVSAAFQPVERVFNTGQPTVLMIGTLPHKNIERTVEALKPLACRLHLIGRMPESTRQALDASGLEYVNSFDLTTTQMAQAYADCDIVCFASLYEGFGMPIVEAQATGRVVITSNLSSMPEVAGEGACLVDPSSAEAIRDGVERVIRDADYRKQLIEAGRENVKRFRPHAVAAQYIEIYRELLG